MSELPDFNFARGAANLTSTPPYDLPGVSTRVFPVPASIDRLSEFCDSYLNIMPPEIAEFRPSVPYVFMLLSYYPEMSQEVLAGGWVAQNEITFSIFLDRYKKIDGEYVFQDTGSVSPFIFVDQETSQATGREVYGWPKVQGWATPANPWPQSPDSSEPLIRVSTNVFPQVFRNTRIEKRVFLEIDRETQGNDLTRRPPNPRAALNPFSVFSEAIANSMDFWSKAMDLTVASPARGYDKREFLARPEKLTRMLSTWDLFTMFNTFNIKQFRDANETDKICYQALVSSQIEVVRYTTGSMLGNSALLRGDPSGGFRISLHRFPSLPIVRTLGIEVEAHEAGPEAEVAVLRPEFPFWLEANVRYQKGKNICWRRRACKEGSGWYTRPEEGANISFKKTVGQEAVEDDENTVEDESYNTSRGPAIVSLPGPSFFFPDATVRVLPLLADKALLEKFCAKYLNSHDDECNKAYDADFTMPKGLAGQTDFSFEPFGRYVYMLIWSYDQVSSELGDIGEFASHDVRFSIPVRVFDKNDKEEREKRTPLSMGLLTPFIYSDSEITTVTARELYGLPVLRSQITSPEGNWLERLGPEPGATRGLLDLKAPVLADLLQGPQMEFRQLIEVFQGDIGYGFTGEKARESGSEWGEVLLSELIRKERDLEEDPKRNPNKQPVYVPKSNLKNAMALSLELLALKNPVNEFSLKQFRDAGDPAKACYQSIVRTPMKIDRLRDLREIETQVHVRIHKIASQPIVTELGLVTKVQEREDETYILEPVRPFWMRLDLSIDRAENIWVAHDEHHDSGFAKQGYLSDQENIRLGHGVTDGIGKLKSDRDDRPPSYGKKVKLRSERVATWAFWRRFTKRHNLAEWVRTWRKDKKNGPMSLFEARQALASTEPQKVIECILSKEWANRGSCRIFLRDFLNDDNVKQKPYFCVRRDSAGHAAHRIFPKSLRDRAYALSVDDLDGWYPCEITEPKSTEMPGNGKDSK